MTGFGGSALPAETAEAFPFEVFPEADLAPGFWPDAEVAAVAVPAGFPAPAAPGELEEDEAADFGPGVPGWTAGPGEFSWFAATVAERDPPLPDPVLGGATRD